MAVTTLLYKVISELEYGLHENAERKELGGHQYSLLSSAVVLL